jgi:hypothetical protein
MQDKNQIEENIRKLLNSGINADCQLDEQIKERTLELLSQKITQRKRISQTDIKVLVATTAIWIFIIVLISCKIENSMYLTGLIKPALGLSMCFIPVSSFVLIILNKKKYEKELV